MVADRIQFPCWEALRERHLGFIIWIIVALDLAKAFSHGTGLDIGLIFLTPIFALVLGFGSDTYNGAAAKTA